MKTRLLFTLLAVVLLCATCPITAFAANETDITATVVYTKAQAASYEIDIPYTNNLNGSEFIIITANNITLPEGASVQVSVDAKRSFSSDGWLVLTNSTKSAAINCVVSRIHPTSGEASNLSIYDEFVVSFKQGDTPATKQGKLKITPLGLDETPAGNYSGFMHFNIEVVTN